MPWGSHGKPRRIVWQPSLYSSGGSEQAALGEDLVHGGAHLRGRLDHRHARRLQRRYLVGGCALAACTTAQPDL